MVYRQDNLEQIHYCHYQRKFIDFKMDEMIVNANAYSAFLDGTATNEEVRTILETMLKNPRLMMTLNLAACITDSNK